jgi:hypothetical protein
MPESETVLSITLKLPFSGYFAYIIRRFYANASAAKEG